MYIPFKSKGRIIYSHKKEVISLVSQVFLEKYGWNKKGVMYASDDEDLLSDFVITYLDRVVW